VATTAAVARAAAVIRRGGLVAFPTETVYGLGANALDAKAVRGVFKAKGRPSDNPLIVHCASLRQARSLVKQFPPVAEKLARAFMPGALTLVLKHNGSLPKVVTANLDTVAVRIPNHSIALALIRAAGVPLVAPSANRSGRPSPTTAQHVADDLRGKVDIILDAGPTRIGLESTVVDVTSLPPVILRLGGITTARIRKVIGRVKTIAEAEQLRRSPGTRHKHYSPRAQVVLVARGDAKEFVRLMTKLVSQKRKIGILVHSKSLCRAAERFSSKANVCALPSDVETIARRLFDSLRDLDNARPQIIVVEKVQPEGLGAAVLDRLSRAANTRG
jgi:L-threonylcarbamoyladenylate synthase